MSGIAITFPSSPIEGQSHLAQNGFTYIYDSQKNRWKRGGEFVRAPKVLSYAGVAVTTTGSGITTGPTGALIYEVPGTLIPSSDVGIDSYKAYRTTDSYPNYTEVQVSISSAFSSVAYAATSTSTTFSIPAGTLSGNTTYYMRARQFVGSNASAASTGAISGYSQNIVKFTTASVFLDAPTIVSIAGTTRFPVYQIGFAGTTLPATVTYTGGGVTNLDKVEWRATGPRIPSSTGDTALAEVGIGTFSSATLANALVLAMPFSGATGVGITSDVNNAIRTASGASAGTTKTITANGGISTSSIAGLALTSHFYSSAAYFDGSNDYLSASTNSDFAFGTGDFTIEAWVHPTSTSSYRNFWEGGASNSLRVQIASGLVEIVMAGSAVIYAGTIVANVWQHIAVTRKGTVVSLYIDGILRATGTSSANLTSTALDIGKTHDNFYYVGYIQDHKTYKGLAKYQENFTPPLPTYGTISYTTGITNVGVATTSFFESTGDTPTAEASSSAANALVLAMPMNRTFGFQDINVAVRGLTSGASAGTAKTVGLGTTSTANAPSQPRISSTESKWYDGAAYFDGGDYLTIPDSSDVDFGTGDWTIEFWMNQRGSFIDYRAPFGKWTGTLGYWMHTTAAGKIIFSYDGTIRITSNQTLSLNTWYHITFVRSSGVISLYINGILDSTLSYSSSADNNEPFIIGDISTGFGRYFDGYFQDFKIYKGFAKYTANFTPPRPICGFTTDISTQTGFTTTSATGALLSSTVGLGTTSTLAFSADQNLIGVTSITSSSGITTLPDPYAQNLVLALPLANITGVGNSFTNDRNTQIRSVSITGAGVTTGTTKTITNSGVSTVAMGSTSKWYGNTAYTSGGYISITSSADTDLSTSNFTVEGWFNFTSAVSGARFFVFTNGSTYVGLTDDGGTGLQLNLFGTGNYFQAAGCLSGKYSSWVHIALVRNDGVIRLYVDGILTGASTTSTLPSGNLTVSIFGNGGSFIQNNFVGYCQDFKIYKGLAKYTTNFTPPPPMFGDYTRSTPNKLIFTPSSDYVLEARNTSGVTTSNYSATRQWGTKPKGGIYDPYASKLVLAIPGGAVGGATTTFDVTGQIRYETPTASYVNAGIVTYTNSLGIGTYQNKTATNSNVSTETTQSKYYGRSLYFNSTSDRLTIANSSDFQFGTGDFTVEAWIYTDNISGYDVIVKCSSDAGWANGWSVALNDGGLYFYNGGATANTTSQKVSINTWTHIAVTRSSGIVYQFIGGVLYSATSIFSGALNPTDTLSIGNDISSTFNFSGYIQDLRIYKGLAKYTSNFTPPNQIYLT